MKIPAGTGECSPENYINIVGFIQHTCNKLDNVLAIIIVISVSKNQVKTIVCAIFVAFSVLSSDVALHPDLPDWIPSYVRNCIFPCTTNP